MNLYRKIWATIIVLTSSLVVSVAAAHPSVSVVIDVYGNIYYSDLSQVWMISPDGNKKVVVENVHTHELWLSVEGDLYGEDVRSQGDNYRHRVWVKSPDGKVRNVIGWREGFPDEYSDYSFVRDKRGHQYVLDRPNKQVKFFEDEELIRAHSLSEFKGTPRWHAISPEGKVYVSFEGYIVEISDEGAQVFASSLIERTSEFDWVGDHHALLGMWFNSQNELHLAMFSGQKVIKVLSDVTTEIIYEADGDWSVTGGAYTKEGELILLQFSNSNNVRVLKVDKFGNSTVL